MRIAGIYHCSAQHYPLAFQLGFTHVEISVGAWPGNHAAMYEAVRQAHRAGLHAIAGPDFHNGLEAMNFLELSELCPQCFIYLSDEPNMTRTVENMKEEQAMCRRARPDLKTIATLAPIRPYKGYDTVADINAYDYYRTPWDLIELAKMMFHVEQSKSRAKRPFLGVPPIKKAGDIKFWGKFWKKMGAMGTFPYGWSGDGGKWGFSDLSQRPDLMDALRKANSAF